MSERPAQAGYDRLPGHAGGVQQDSSEWRLPMTGTTSAGTVRLADDLVLTRMGYGAIQLAGPMAWGPPKDRDAAQSVLRAVVDLGITHIDTSDYYGPHTVNELIHHRSCRCNKFKSKLDYSRVTVSVEEFS